MQFTQENETFWFVWLWKLNVSLAISGTVPFGEQIWGTTTWINSLHRVISFTKSKSKIYLLKNVALQNRKLQRKQTHLKWNLVHLSTHKKGGGELDFVIQKNTKMKLLFYFDHNSQVPIKQILWYQKCRLFFKKKNKEISY